MVGCVDVLCDYVVVFCVDIVVFFVDNFVDFGICNVFIGVGIFFRGCKWG